MFQFSDQNGNEVQLSFSQRAFAKDAAHVLVICRYQHQWLLTAHPVRGWEFPGGKAEEGETAEAAAIREVYEETGGRISRLEEIGQYLVKDPNQPFVKTIFFGEVIAIEPRDHYMETEDPVLFSGDLLKERMKEHFSFIMKDRVIEDTFAFLHRTKRI